MRTLLCSTYIYFHYSDLEETIEQENMVTEEKTVLDTREYREAIEVLSETKHHITSK